MPETKTCPKCGAELPVNAPSGICPRCLMQAGLESEQDPGSATEMNPTTLASGFVPPQPEDLARFFPQLETQALRMLTYSTSVGIRIAKLPSI